MSLDCASCDHVIKNSRHLLQSLPLKVVLRVLYFVSLAIWYRLEIRVVPNSTGTCARSKACWWDGYGEIDQRIARAEAAKRRSMMIRACRMLGFELYGVGYGANSQLIAKVKAVKRYRICTVHGEIPKRGSETTRQYRRSIVGEACFYIFFYIEYSNYSQISPELPKP